MGEPQHNHDFQLLYERDTAWLLHADRSALAQPLTADELETLRRCLVFVACNTATPHPHDLKIAAPELFLLVAYVYAEIQDGLPGGMHPGVWTWDIPPDEDPAEMWIQPFVPHMVAAWPDFPQQVLDFLLRRYNAVPRISAADATAPAAMRPYQLRAIITTMSNVYQAISRMDAIYTMFDGHGYEHNYQRPRLFEFNADGHEFSFAGAMLLTIWSSEQLSFLQIYERMFGGNTTFDQDAWDLSYRDIDRVFGNLRVVREAQQPVDVAQVLAGLAQAYQDRAHDHATAFMSAFHPRMGENSAANVLTEDLGQHIVEMFLVPNI